MTFNDKIDLFMEQNNYANLKQLAIACGIPYTTLKDFYDKKSADNSRLSTIRKLSKFMGCSMDYLSYDDVVDFNKIPVEKEDNVIFDELDEVLFSKTKELTDDEKRTVINIMDAIKKNIDKEM